MAKKLTIYKSDTPILKRCAEEVLDPSHKNISSLIDDMLHTVMIMDGVGLAAPQIGVSKRIIIVASKPNKRYPHAPDFPAEAMINPTIKYQSNEQETDWEGCLSVDNARGKVPRSKEVTVSYFTREGLQIEKSFAGFLARIIQHEIDHLNGITFVERMPNNEQLLSELEFLNLVNSTS